MNGGNAYHFNCAMASYLGLVCPFFYSFYTPLKNKKKPTFGGWEYV